MNLTSPTARKNAMDAINALPVADVLTLREIRHTPSTRICDVIKAKLYPAPGVNSSTRKVRMIECLFDYERANAARGFVLSALLTALGAHARHAETFGAS